MTIEAMTPRTQRDMERDWPCWIAGCDHGSCELTFASRCHEGKACEVVYLRAQGVLAVKCWVCGTLIANVAVRP